RILSMVRIPCTENRGTEALPQPMAGKLNILALSPEHVASPCAQKTGEGSRRLAITRLKRRRLGVGRFGALPRRHEPLAVRPEKLVPYCFGAAAQLFRQSLLAIASALDVRIIARVAIGILDLRKALEIRCDILEMERGYPHVAI